MPFGKDRPPTWRERRDSASLTIRVVGWLVVQGWFQGWLVQGWFRVVVGWWLVGWLVGGWFRVGLGLVQGGLGWLVVGGLGWWLVQGGGWFRVVGWF